MSFGETIPSPEPANILSTAGSFDPALPYTDLHLPDGHVLRVATSLLISTAPVAAAASSDDVTIPIVEERLEVSRRTVETGKVRLHKTVQEFETALDETLAVRTYDVEHVVLNQPVEDVPGVRIEGDTTIYPLVEEQLVLTKQLILKEEVRVTRRDTERRDTRSVTLRREHLVVEREAVK